MPKSPDGTYRYPHPRKPGVLISRQYLWQLRNRAVNRCVECAEKTEGGPYCASHQVLKRRKQRAYARRRYGFSPWQPGSQGRKPMGVDHQPVTAAEDGGRA